MGYGSGAHNDITGQANIIRDRWRTAFGRDITDGELQYILGTAGDGTYWSRGDQVIGQIKSTITETKNFAKDYGFTLTDDQAWSLVSGASGGNFASGIPGNVMDHVQAQLGTAYAESKVNPTVDPFTGTRVSTAQYNNDINSIFQSRLGRDATAAELEHYGKDILSGSDLYLLDQAVQNSSEYMQKQADLQATKYNTEATAAREALNQELLRQQGEAFQKQLPSILSSYMKSGRLNSSALDAQVANTQRDLESQRQAYMGNLAYQDAVRTQGYNRQDYVNSIGQAYQNYMNANAPYASRQMSAVQNAYGLPLQYAQQNQQRAWELADYNRDRIYWENYANQADKNSGLAGGLYGAISGAGTGAQFGPWGAAIGGLAGAGLGYAGTRRK